MENQKRKIDKVVPKGIQRVATVAVGTVVILASAVVLLKLGKVMLKDVKDMGL